MISKQGKKAGERKRVEQGERERQGKGKGKRKDEVRERGEVEKGRER